MQGHAAFSPDASPFRFLRNPGAANPAYVAGTVPARPESILLFEEMIRISGSRHHPSRTAGRWTVELTRVHALAESETRNARRDDWQWRRAMIVFLPNDKKREQWVAGWPKQQSSLSG
jgi:hypothetical protein